MTNISEFICSNFYGTCSTAQATTLLYYKRISLISEYIQKIKTIGDSLYVTGHAIPDHELILSALNVLVQEYELVIDVLTHSMKQNTLQEIQYALLMRETRIEQQNLLTQVNISNPPAI